MRKRKSFQSMGKVFCLMLAIILAFGVLPLQIISAEADEPSAEALTETPNHNTEADLIDGLHQNSKNNSPSNSDQETLLIVGTKLAKSAGAASSGGTSSSNSISGTLWYDSNEDGVKDAGELPVVDFPVHLFLEDDKTNSVEIVETDADGKYEFTDIEPGTYVVGIERATVNGTEYLLPLFGISGDNKFALDTSEWIFAYTESITVSADSVTVNMDAALRTQPQKQGFASWSINGDITSSASSLSAAINVINGDGGTNYTVTTSDTGSEAVSAVMNINANKNVTIQSTGATPITITMTSSYRRHFRVFSNGSLTLQNIILDGNVFDPNASTGGGVDNYGSFTMNAGVLITNCSDTYGGGVRMEAGTFEMKGGEIRGNATPNALPYAGGGVYLNGGTFNMSGGTIANNNGFYGGGVYLNGGTFNMSGGTIANNAAQGGAGVNVNSYGTFNMNGTTAEISGNTVTISGGTGGGVFNAGAFTMTAGKITGNNSANQGGGVYTFSGLLSNSTFDMNGADAEISDNSANQGGGVYVEEGTVTTTTSFTMSDGEISGNTATNGGGVVVNNGVFTMNGANAEIRENKATNTGGGVYNAGEYTITAGKVTGNNASLMAGGVYVAGDSVFTMNGTAAEVSDNTTTWSGGGVWLASGCTFAMQNGSISNNAAGTMGGGVYLMNGTSATLNISGGKISNNDAKWGGGMYLHEGTINMSGGSISGNTAIIYGGGVVIDYNNKFIMSGGNISGNTVTYSADGMGGGVYVANPGSTFSMTGGIVGGSAAADANTAANGGGVYIREDATFDMLNGEINGNDATNNGGGVYNSGTLTMNNATAKISGNTVTDSADGMGGGGVYSSGTFDMVNGEISDNTATTSYTGSGGGGVYVYSGTFTMSGGKISGNHALTAANGGAGGGVHVCHSATVGSTFNMQGGEISGNDATYEGGGVQNYGTLNMSGGEISSNSALYGGGVVSSGGPFTMSGTTAKISGNTASKEGGGLWLINSTFNMNGGSIIDNDATSGGGVFVLGGTFTISGATAKLSGNEATTGGGVYIWSGTLNIQNGEISSNSANHGGGVFNNGTFTMSSAAAKISGNEALTGNGGGVYNRATLNVQMGEISGNTASAGDGGGIYNTIMESGGYSSLAVESAVVFSNNTSSQAVAPPPNPLTDYPNIQSASTSVYAHPLNNHDISRSLVTVTVYYVDESDGGLGTPGSATYVEGYGNTFALASTDIPTISSYVFSNWKIGLSGTLQGNTTVSVTNVTANTDIYLVYAVADFTITEKYVNKSGNPIVNALGIDEPDTYKYIAPGATYNAGGTAPSISPLYVCIGYKIGNAGDSFSAATSSTTPTITSVSSDQVVYYVYGLLVDLTVSNTTAGAYADKTKAFTYTIFFTDDSGAPLANESFNYTGGIIAGSDATAPADGILTLSSSGVGTFTLQHGQTITIKGVTEAYKVHIVETNDNYSTIFKDSVNPTITVASNDTGERLITDVNRTFDFTNTRSVVPAGISLDDGNMVVLMSAALLALSVGAAITLARRRIRARR